MSTAITTAKNMQTADKRAITGKLASFGQLLALPGSITEIEVELCVVLVVEEVVDSVVINLTSYSYPPHVIAGYSQSII